VNKYSRLKQENTELREEFARYYKENDKKLKTNKKTKNKQNKKTKNKQKN